MSEIEDRFTAFYQRIIDHANANPNCLIVTEKLYDQELQAWTKENCEHDLVCVPGSSGLCLYVFKNSDDAMAFKLAWVED